MTSLTLFIITAFVAGYACIPTESVIKVNKAAIALLMFVACWTLYMCDPMQYLTLMHPEYDGSKYIIPDWNPVRQVFPQANDPVLTHYPW